MFFVPVDNQLRPAQQNLISYGEALLARADAIETARKGVFIGAVVGIAAGALFAQRDNKMLSVLSATVAPLAGYMIGHQRAVSRWSASPQLVPPQ